jgi:cell pole-organizing protein PopZ
METGALQTLFNQNLTQPVKTASLRPGQIINGKIMKLFPDQIAEIQIGSQKMIAQLETPLSANERYWFQVQPGDGKVRLKVIAAGAEDGKQPESFTRILSEFSMQPSKENLELVRFFLKEQLPVNREILQQVAEWLKSANPRSAGLEAVKMLLSRGLPLSEAAYSALYTSNKEPSLILLMEQLLVALNREPATDVGSKVKQLLNDCIPSNHKMVSRLALGEIAAEWLNDSEGEGQTALKLMQQMPSFPVKGSEVTVLQKLLANLQSLDNQETLSLPLNLLSSLNTALQSNDEAAIRQMLSGHTSASSDSKETAGLADAVKVILRSQEATGQNSNIQESIHTLKHFLARVMDKTEPDVLVKGLSVLLGRNMDDVGTELLKHAERGIYSSVLSENETVLLAKVIANAEQTMALSEAGETVLSPTKIKEFLSSLGLSYEQQLAEAFKGSFEEKAQTADLLKPQLIRLLNENPPQAVKEAAEQLLNKITGFQLLSQESGPIQQMIVQVPFVLGGQMTDVTMQWSGKKTEDGKIDADFCRVLLYLNLENLNETIIDIQVQNRIISIQVFNQNDNLKKMSEQLFPVLKEKLAAIHYQLSAVSFQVPGKVQASENKKLANLYGKKEYSRVDIKI